MAPDAIANDTIILKLQAAQIRLAAWDYDLVEHKSQTLRYWDQIITKVISNHPSATSSLSLPHYKYLLLNALNPAVVTAFSDDASSASSASAWSDPISIIPTLASAPSNDNGRAGVYIMFAWNGESALLFRLLFHLLPSASVCV